MASWTPERSTILSMLLDKVVGTPEMIHIRQDFCRISDCILSSGNEGNKYFTGSKAEGLDLPGSDKDYMLDVNNELGIRVTQSMHERPDNSTEHLLFLCTENVPICFATLRFINHIVDPFFIAVSRNVNGVPHLSSWLLVQDAFSFVQNNSAEGETHARQGPSVEHWTEYCDKSASGNDRVISIHCPFWPEGAIEWIQRPRQFGWPIARDISSIVDFGCHVVPVGHPNSPRNAMEWRISFSVAERILVWSFNQVQMQCYAVMKILLKEFINVKCSPQNRVLCSYFIKTFLFWQFELQNVNFWHVKNLRECVRYLMFEFFKCLRDGIIRHYFFPKFNLLSVKLTPEAQTEILQLLDIAIQSDIAVFKECRTLRPIWSEFLCIDDSNTFVHSIQRANIPRNDECIMQRLHLLNQTVFLCFAKLKAEPMDSAQNVRSISCKTDFKLLVIQLLLSLTDVCHASSLQYPRNKDAYKMHRTAYNEDTAFDVSTSKLWYAMVLLKRGDYQSCLGTINKVLSIIPPFPMYMSRQNNQTNHEGKQLYSEMYFGTDIQTSQRARTAWLFDLIFCRTANSTGSVDMLPLAIQIELRFADRVIFVSPFIFAYYLMFLCYHELRHYDDRDRALRQLVEVVNNPQQHGSWQHHSLNIAGHCLLMAGKTSQARDMFIRSFRITMRNPPFYKYNSALHYLSYMTR